jgi:hypothetical protein
MPVGIVERRIGEDEIGASNLCANRGGKCRRVRCRNVGLNAANGEIHHGEPPRGGIAFLPVNRNVADASAVGFHKFFGLHEHSARAAARVIDAAFVGREHFDEQPHDAVGRVKLPAVLALGAGEFSTTETILKLCRPVQSAVKPFCENLFHSERGRIGVFSSCAIRRV